MVSQITQLLIAASRLPDHSLLSIGVVVDDDIVYWGDVVAHGEDALSPDVLSLVLEPALIGRPLTSFKALCAGLPRTGEGQNEIESLTDGVQQALLSAVAAQARLTPAELLAKEYGLLGRKPGPIEPPLFLEISDFAATAGRIDEMLALRPAAIGYRLTGSQPAAALGDNAEYLQRFVRELAERITSTADPAGRPAIYLGLNGALGVLVGDPRRQIGRVMGHCAGLQAAAGALDLYLEEPFLLNEQLAQAALLRQLKEYCGSSRAFEKQPQFAARVRLDDEALAVYSDVQAADALAVDVGVGRPLDQIMSRLSDLSATGIRVNISCSRHDFSTIRWLTTIVEMAIASSAGLLLSIDPGNEGMWEAVSRQLLEASAWAGRE